MKYLVLFILALVITLSSCNKKDIQPNSENTSIDHNSKKGSGSSTDSGNCGGENGTITDPNNDEDESKKIKKGK